MSLQHTQDWEGCCLVNRKPPSSSSDRLAPGGLHSRAQEPGGRLGEPGAPTSLPVMRGEENKDSILRQHTLLKTQFYSTSLYYKPSWIRPTGCSVQSPNTRKKGLSVLST